MWAQDKRAAAMYASRVLQAAMFSVPSMLPMSFTVVKRWNVLGSIVAADGLTMSGGHFDLTDETEIRTVRALILGRKEGREEVAIPEPKPGSICLQYFGTNASTQASPTDLQDQGQKGKACNLLLFYAVLADRGGEPEGGESQPDWRCDYGRVDWRKLRALKDILATTSAEVEAEADREILVKKLEKILQAFAKVFLYVGSDQEPDKADPSQRKKIVEVSKIHNTAGTSAGGGGGGEAAEAGAGATMEKDEIVSILNQFKAMLDASVGIDIVHPWVANWLHKVLVSEL